MNEDTCHQETLRQTILKIIAKAITALEQNGNQYVDEWEYDHERVLIDRQILRLKKILTERHAVND